VSTQDIPSRTDFRERARANDVAVARLIGFEAKNIADGRATVILAAGSQHANPMGTLHGGILCDIADAARLAGTTEGGRSRRAAGPHHRLRRMHHS
jgi:acyl-coenzyme A thioesterase PaaI-like protein